MKAVEGFGAQMWRLARPLAGATDPDICQLRALLLAFACLAYRDDLGAFREMTGVVVRRALQEETRMELAGALTDAAIRSGILAGGDLDGEPS